MLQWRRLPLLLYGIVLVSAGLAIHLVGTVALVLTDTIAPGFWRRSGRSACSS